MLRLILLKLLLWAWQHKLIAIGVIALLGASVVFVVFSRQPSPADPELLRLQYEDIVPGSSTHQDLIDSAGVFDTQYTQGEYQVYTYNSPSSNYAPDRFYLHNDKVALKELYFNPLQRKVSKNLISSRYGKPEAYLYTNAGLGGFNSVWVYPDLGVAVFLINDEHVVRLQFFAETTLDDYKNGWGKDLIETKPTPVETLEHTD